MRPNSNLLWILGAPNFESTEPKNRALKLGLCERLFQDKPDRSRALEIGGTEGLVPAPAPTLMGEPDTSVIAN